MEPPAKRPRLSPPVEQRQFHESSSDDDEFYAPAVPKEQAKQQPREDHRAPEAPEETDVDDEVEILDEGEEVEEIDEAEVNVRRAQSLNKVRSRWDEICEKYGREFDNADEIDLITLEVVVDKGHILQMRDENDVGNGQPTPRRERLKGQHVVDHVLSRSKDGDNKRITSRDPSLSQSRIQHKSDLNHIPAAAKSMAQQAVYEDESSDDDFLYEKSAAPAVLAPRQPQGINQIRPRGGSRTVVEKRTIITTRRITTSTIRDGRSDRTDSRDENGRQTSHERTREVHRYKSSQEKIVETSSDDELVQRSPPQQPAQIQVEDERPPSPRGKVSLWAPRMKAGRPRLAYDDRGTPQRHVSRRDRTQRYDEHGRKIRKQRNDRGKMRKPEHLRKTKFVQRYPHLHQDSQNSESSMTGESSPSRLAGQKPDLPSERTESLMSAPTTTLEETPPPKPVAKAVVFERNKVDKSYDFSDEEDDALPQRPLPSLLTAHSTDPFIGQDVTQPASETVQPQYDAGYAVQHDHKEAAPFFEPPHSPPPPYTEYDYQPSPMSAYNPSLDHRDYAAPMAPMVHMETMHQSLPVEDDSQDTSGFMDTYLSFPETSQYIELPAPQHRQQEDIKPDETAPLMEAEKVESEDDLSIPIDPALLALDAENRAASLERAEFANASDPTDEPGMEGRPVPTLPFEELVGYKKSLHEEDTQVAGDSDDDSDDLFAPQPLARARKPSVDDEIYVDKGAKVDEDLDSFQAVIDYGDEPAVAEEASPITDVMISTALDEEGGLVDVAVFMEDHPEPEAVEEAPAWILNAEQAKPLNDEDDLLHSALSTEPPPDPLLTEQTSSMRNTLRTEVPDSDADSEDELLTQASSQPPPRTDLFSSQPSSAQVTPRTKEAMKRVRFSANLILDETPRAKLSPSPASILRRKEESSRARPPSPPSSEPQSFSDPVDEIVDDDEDDLALVPSTPAARSKSRAKSMAEVASASVLIIKGGQAPPEATSRSTLPVIKAPPVQPSEPPIERPRRNEFASSKSNLNPPSSSRSRSTTPQPPTRSTSSSKSTPVSRANPPRLFSLSVSPQPMPKRKLRASLLSESASTTPRRAANATPPPPTQAQTSGVRRRGGVGRLLSASPSLGGPPPGQRRPREDWA